MPECNGYISCDTANLSLEDLLRLLIQTDSEGCPALKVVDVAPEPEHSFVTNWRNPSIAVQDDNIGPPEWLNPENIFALDSVYSEVSSPSTEYSKTIRALRFQFSLENIPPTATITGIEARINRADAGNTGDIVEVGVYIAVNQEPEGDNHALGGTWNNTYAYYSYGGLGDLWGIADSSVAAIEDANFGLALQVRLANALSLASVDNMQMRIYYDTV